MASGSLCVREMVVRDFVVLSLSNLRKRGVRSWLTMVGIFIGIAAVVSLISLGQGLQSAITGQFSNLDPNKLVVQNAETGFGPPGSTAVEKLNDHDLDLIADINGVDVAIQRLIRVVNTKYNKISEFTYVANIPDDDKQIDVIYDSLNVGVSEGRLLTKSDRGKIIVGNDFTDDRFEKKVRVGSKLEIQGKMFEVVGIMKKASSFQINSVILMPDKDLREILGIGDEIDLIVVQTKDGANVNTVAEDIRQALRKDRHLEEDEDDFSVQTPEQSVQAINTILTIINLIVTGIAAVSLFVGGVGITNTMYTAVVERTKEIGVMKAVGARNRDILFLFLIESALLGLVGGVIGAAIGLLLAFLAAYAVSSAFPGLPFNITISWPLIIASVGFSFLVGAFSGLFPSFQAARLKPVQALRG